MVAKIEPGVSNFRKRHTRNAPGRTSEDLVAVAAEAGLDRETVAKLSTSELRLRLDRAGINITRFADARNLRETIERAGNWHAEHAEDMAGENGDEVTSWYDRENMVHVPAIDNGVWLYRFAAGLILSAFDQAVEDALTRPDAFTYNQKFLAAGADEAYWFGTCAQLIGFDPEILSTACMRVIDDHAEAARAAGVVPIASAVTNTLFAADDMEESYSQRDTVRGPRKPKVAANDLPDLFSKAG